MTTELILIGALIVVLVFLSTIESAYESLSEVSLRVMLSGREDSPRGRFFEQLIEHRLSFELILVFGTQTSIVLAAIILFDAANRSGLPYPFLIALVFAIIIVMLFRQLVPRLIAQNSPEEVLWALLPFFRLYHRLFYPVITPIQAVLSRMKRSTPDVDQEEPEQDETKDEIQAFIDVGEEQGIIEESEGEMIQSIVEFSDTRVAEVMRPRPAIVAIQSTATVADARKLIMESKYSRIPVYRDQLDNIEGFIHVRDLLAFCEADKLKLPVTACLRPAYFIPESKPVAELLEEMRTAKVQTAIVIDEFGGVAGLVTIEDIVEEIVGEIEDEDRAGAQTEIIQEEDGSYLVDGRAEIKKVELLFEKDIEADDFNTVAGLIINELGHVPTVGEKLLFKGLEFEVADADSRRVNRVRLRTVPELSTGAGQSSDQSNA